MKEKEIIVKIEQILRDNIPGFLEGELSMDTPINSEKGVDSLGFILLMSKIQEEFGFEIPPRKWGKIQTLGDLVAFIEKKFN